MSDVRRIPTYFVFPVDDSFNLNELEKLLRSIEFKEKINNSKSIILTVDQNISYYHEAIKTKILNINVNYNLNHNYNK